MQGAKRVPPAPATAFQPRGAKMSQPACAMQGTLGPTAARALLARQEPTRTCAVPIECLCAVVVLFFQMARKVLFCTENRIWLQRVRQAAERVPTAPPTLFQPRGPTQWRTASAIWGTLGPTAAGVLNAGQEPTRT
jgi:hypothetical protein